MHPSMLFLIFAVALVLYGAAIAKTGNKDLLPYRAQHSVRNAEDVRRVGRITVVVGLVIGTLSLVGIAVGSLAS